MITDFKNNCRIQFKNGVMTLDAMKNDILQNDTSQNDTQQKSIKTKQKLAERKITSFGERRHSKPFC